MFLPVASSPVLAAVAVMPCVCAPAEAAVPVTVWVCAPAEAAVPDTVCVWAPADAAVPETVCVWAPADAVFFVVCVLLEVCMYAFAEPVPLLQTLPIPWVCAPADAAVPDVVCV